MSLKDIAIELNYTHLEIENTIIIQYINNNYHATITKNIAKTSINVCKRITHANIAYDTIYLSYPACRIEGQESDVVKRFLLHLKDIVDAFVAT